MLDTGSNVEFRILGPVEALLEGRPLPLGSRKQRMLLAALLLRPNEVVSVDQLIDALWGEAAPKRAAKSLQVYVWQLRKMLGHEVLQTRPPGYALVLTPNALDLHRFESLLAEARAEEPIKAATILREALGFFRGRPLAEFAYERFAEVEVARIEELRLEALEERIEADLALGRHAALVGELEALVADQLLRERPRAQLMVALYRCGRQAEALAAYREGRRVLVDELGIDPGRSLQELEQAVLRQDPALELTRSGAAIIAPDQAKPNVAAPRALPEERKVVSVLVVDLGDFATPNLADPEDLRAALQPFHAAAKREIERHGGTVERLIGDRLMAVFGAPVAHEDDPERAVRAALAIRDWVREQGVNPRLRIAVNTGVALVSVDSGAREGEAIAAGDVVNTTQRIVVGTSVDGVFVGEQTHRVTREAIEYREASLVVATGKSEPTLVWEALEARSRVGADLLREHRAPLVGRERELDLLRSALARVREERSPQLVTLVGVPGIGKSRLVFELFEEIDQARDLITWRQGRCLPYGDGVSFWALGEAVKAQAGILESDTPAQASEKLAAAVAASVEDASEREWFKTRLAPLVGAQLVEAPGTAERAESFTAWRRFLEGLADTRPLVLVMEDLHWADEGLLDFVDELADRVRDTPLLMLCTSRPELLERRPGWGGGKANALTISLPPLSDDETASVVRAASDDRVPAEAEKALLERAAGNPLYAEQFARALGEAGSFVELPETVHGIIAARLDALSSEEKELLQNAAVVGKVFWLGALEAIGGGSRRRAEELLYGLERKEFVQQARRPSIAREAEYMFQHVLLRDVAYEQIPRLVRVAKHRAAAQWIELVAEDRVTDHAEILAHHYAHALELVRAAESADDTNALEAPARRFLVMAGDRAFAIDAPSAEAYYRQALELFAPGQPDRASVLTKAAEAAWQTGRFATAKQHYEEAIRELRAHGNPLGVAEAMVSLSLVQAIHGETERARTLLTEVVMLLERKPPGRELAQAYAQIARERTLSGLHREALDWAQKSLDLAEQFGPDPVSVTARHYRGFARCQLGDLGGLADLRGAVDASVDLGLGHETMRAYTALGFFVWFIEGPSNGLDVLRAGIALGERRGISAVVLWTKGETLWLLFDLGEWEELLRLAGELIEWDRKHGGSYFGVMALTYKACVLVYRGRIEEAAELSEEFATRARKIGDPQVLAPALTIAARVEQARGRMNEALLLIHELDGVTERDPLARANQVADAVRVCAAAGDLGLGQRLVEGVDAVMARQRHSVITARAILAEAGGTLDGAASLYDDAATAWEDYGHVLERGQALLGLGRCRQSLGLADGSASLSVALEIFAQLGAHPLATEAEELLDKARSTTS
jgi:DNA-binding SARP family transcriptional activator/tetratricopeptide (TPR) repeat protein